MNRDAAKQIGARHSSPVSSAIRREELKPEDLPRRIQFCTWIFNQAKMANLKRAILLFYFSAMNLFLVSIDRPEMLQRFQKCTL